MKKIAIHIDENDRLLLLQYKNVDETKKSSFLRGSECYDYIKKLGQNEIVDVYEHPNGKDITLEYNKYIIELNDYLVLLNKRGMGPILNNVRIYNEKVELKNKMSKKVVRKNKYTKARLIAGGLSLLIISGCVMGMFSKSKTKVIQNGSTSIIDNLEEDFVRTVDIENNEVNIMNLHDKSDIEKQKIPSVAIEYSNRGDTSKAIKTKAYYGELINKYSKMYGLDSKLVTAIATQERGIHSGVKDAGGATGLMQVQNAVWAGEKLSAYNFITKSKETIIVDEKSLSAVDYNIKVGCMILQNTFKQMNYNTLAAIQCYNMGYGHMNTIFKAYSGDSGKSIEEILKDVTDTNWMDYRYLIKRGDPEYIEEVFSWLGDDIKLQNKLENGKEVCLNINSPEQVKTIH